MALESPIFFVAVVVMHCEIAVCGAKTIFFLYDGPLDSTWLTGWWVQLSLLFRILGVLDVALIVMFIAVE
jgi:hypothetical protein